MTDDEAKALGLRAVACHGWRPLAGVLERACDNAAISRRACFEEADGIAWVVRAALPNGAHWPAGGGWPDFRDPATLGCLLALVREVLGEAWAYVQCDAWGEDCRVMLPAAKRAAGEFFYLSEAEALVAALEAAPRREVPT